MVQTMEIAIKTLVSAIPVVDTQALSYVLLI